MTPTLSDFTAFRERLGMSARAASLALGLHENYVSRIERGEREFKPMYYWALIGYSEHQRKGQE